MNFGFMLTYRYLSIESLTVEGGKSIFLNVDFIIIFLKACFTHDLIAIRRHV